MCPADSARGGESSAPEWLERAVREEMDPFSMSFDTEHLTLDLDGVSTGLGLLVVMNHITNDG